MDLDHALAWLQPSALAKTVSEDEMRNPSMAARGAAAGVELQMVEDAPRGRGPGPPTIDVSLPGR